MFNKELKRRVANLETIVNHMDLEHRSLLRAIEESAEDVIKSNSTKPQSVDLAFRMFVNGVNTRIERNHHE